MRFRHALVAGVVTTSVLCSSIASVEARNDKVNYQAQISWTSYGIPHIKAENWASLGYGYGYAFARDNVCVLARDVLAANGTQARYFGPGTDSSNIISDSVYAMVNSQARVAASWATLDKETTDLLRGYADGYNRYIRDTGNANLPADCRGAAWVQPITGEDVYRTLRKLLVRASTGNFVPSIFGAAPPPPPAPVAFSSGPAAGESPSLPPARSKTASRLVAAATLPDFSPELFGSNAVALGSELTGGAGALLGNPHFPWRGIERFYSVHLTIPGRYDAMGASIYGFPLINIGFNRHLAWSHTVSTARRFVVRELTLAPGNPTAYVYEGQVVPMQPEVTTIDVANGAGGTFKFSHTFYQTQFGPVLIIPPAAPWTTTRAYALTDVNLENTRAFQLYREMATSRSVEEFSQSLERHVGLPWVNTIAADAQGQRLLRRHDGRAQHHQRAVERCDLQGLPVCAGAVGTARLYGERCVREVRSGHRCRCAGARHLRARQPAEPDADRLRAELQRQLLAVEPGGTSRGVLQVDRRRREAAAELPHAPRRHADQRPHGRRR